MNIITVYKTSKGIFLLLEEADRNKNRAKIDDPYDPSFGQREVVITCKALHHEGQFFELKELQVQQ